MRNYGSITELSQIIFREDNQAITMDANSSTTYTASRTVELPPGDQSSILVGESNTQALSNKTLDGDLNTIQDLSLTSLKTVLADANKVIRRDASGIVISGNAIPNSSAILTTDSTATVSNKQIDSTNEAVLQDVNFAIVDNGDQTKQFKFNISSVSPATIVTWDIPNGSSTFVGTALSQLLENKSLDDSTTSITDTADPSKTIKFSAGGTASTSTTLAAAQTANRVLTLPDATDTLVGKATTDILTNKTLQNDLVDNYLDFNEESAPATPASGTARLYAKSDGQLYSKDDAGIETALGGSGSGSGEINLIDNPNEATGWVASGAGITVATTTTTAEIPLNDIFQQAIKIDPVSGTDYVRYRWTAASALKNKKLKIEWYQKPESGYLTGDLKVEIYKNSASDYTGSYTEFNLSTDSSGTSAIPNATGKYFSTFDADDGDYYELRIVRVAGTSFMAFNNFIVGPGIQPQGAVVTPWLAYTPTTQGLGTISGVNFFYTRVGEKLRVQGRLTTGTTAASEMRIGLPTGLTVGSTNATTFVVGRWYRNVTGAATTKTGSLNTSGGLTYINGANDDPSNTSSPLDARNGSALYGNTEVVIFEFEIPIAEWAGSGTVNVVQNDVEYAYNTTTADTTDTTSFGYGPRGVNFGSFTTARNKRVRFQNPLQAGDTVQLEISDDGIAWHTSSNSVIMQRLDQGAQQYGMWLERVSSTDFDVAFAAYRVSNNATYAGAGAAWSGITTKFWRVKKVAGGQAVGFGTVSENSSGLMPASNTSLDNAAATRMGFKQYLHGTSYNGGNAPTVTGTSMTVVRAVFIPYQMQGGEWRMRFNLAATRTTGSSSASFTVTVNGITFKNVTNYIQPVSASASNLANDRDVGHAHANPNTNTLQLEIASNDIASFRLSGDVELDSKPTWAY